MDRDNWNIKDEADTSAMFGSDIFGDDEELDLVLEDDMHAKAEKAAKKESAANLCVPLSLREREIMFAYEAF